MRGNLLFEIGHAQQGGIAEIGGVRVTSAERQDVEIVVADPATWRDGLRAVGCESEPAPAIHPDIRHDRHLLLADAVFFQEVGEGDAHLRHALAQEVEVPAPGRVVGNAEDVGRVVDVMAGFDGGHDRLDGDRAGGRVAEADPEPGDPRLEAYVFREFDHGHNGDAGVAGRRGKINAPLRRKLAFLRGGPFKVRLRLRRKFRRQPLHAHVGHRALGHIHRRGSDRGRGLLGFKHPSLRLAKRNRLATVQGPVIDRGSKKNAKRVAIRHERQRKMPTHPAGLRPHRKRPALRMAEPVVLVGGDISFRGKLAQGEVLARGLELRTPLGVICQSRPGHRAGNPRIPQCPAGEKPIEMPVVEIAHQGHPLLLPRHDEIRKCRLGGRRDIADQPDHLGIRLDGDGGRPGGIVKSGFHPARRGLALHPFPCDVHRKKPRGAILGDQRDFSNHPGGGLRGVGQAESEDIVLLLEKIQRQGKRPILCREIRIAPRLDASDFCPVEEQRRGIIGRKHRPSLLQFPNLRHIKNFSKAQHGLRRRILPEVGQRTGGYLPAAPKILHRGRIRFGGGGQGNAEDRGKRNERGIFHGKEAKRKAYLIA